MKKLGKLLANANGLTLIELLTALTISTLILGAAYSLFYSGINIFQNINGEIRLRDEADIIIANIMNELYKDPINDVKNCSEDVASNPIDRCIQIYTTEIATISIGDSSEEVSITDRHDLRETGKVKIIRIEDSKIEVVYKEIDTSGAEVLDTSISPNPVKLNSNDISVDGTTLTANCNYISAIYKHPSTNIAEVKTKCVNALIDINLAVQHKDSTINDTKLVLNSQFGL